MELILSASCTRGKFSNKNYQFSGGLHGVGISVVNALSDRVEVTVRRDGQVYDIAFERGDKVSDLTITGTCGRRNTGTRVRFWPEARYFDSPRFSVSKLEHLLKAKAVLCPGLTIKFLDKNTGIKLEWCYEDGLRITSSMRSNAVHLPAGAALRRLFQLRAVGGGLGPVLVAGRGECLAESYVNLIPTALGGTHVNGLRQGCSTPCASSASSATSCPAGSS